MFGVTLASERSYHGMRSLSPGAARKGHVKAESDVMIGIQQIKSWSWQ